MTLCKRFECEYVCVENVWQSAQAIHLLHKDLPIPIVVVMGRLKESQS